MALIKKPNRQKIVNYIEDVLYNGSSKKAAYIKHIDDKLKNPNSAVAMLEKRADFKAIYQTMSGDEDAALQKHVSRTQGKYIKLIEKNIDTMSSVLDKANEGEIKDQAVAVRLANETISAMSIVNGSNTPAPGNRSLDKGSVVL